MNRVFEAKVKGEILTGLIFIDQNHPDLHAMLDTVATPLNQLEQRNLVPGAGVLEGINAGWR
jgi:2-oxoglutarate ferredoxin oxidoreductase subunit beta